MLDVGYHRFYRAEPRAVHRGTTSVAQQEPTEVASALSTLDAMNDLQNLPPAVLLAQLQDLRIVKALVGG